MTYHLTVSEIQEQFEEYESNDFNPIEDLITDYGIDCDKKFVVVQKYCDYIDQKDVTLDYDDDGSGYQVWGWVYGLCDMDGLEHSFGLVRKKD